MSFETSNLKRRRRIRLIVVLLLVCGGCGVSETDGPGSWVVERDTVGDTIVVRTVSGSVWGAPVTVVEDLAIGVFEGADELMFGQIQAMATDERGGIYIFDGQVPALRYYDYQGNYVRTLGGEGGGPGEYHDVALGLAVRTDGRLVMRDPRNGRLNVYDPDGTPSDTWLVASGLFAPRSMVLDTADNMYLKILLERPQRNRPWRIGLLRLNSAGEIVDTVPDPQIAGEPTAAGWTFSPTKVWDWSPFAYPVVGVTDDYSFEIRRPDEPVVRVERSFEPVTVVPGERAAYEARNEWMRRYQADALTTDIPPVPATKPAYASITVGELGRIWVRRHVAAVRVGTEPDPEPSPNRPPSIPWREPAVFDVFQPDGRYLGEVRAPERVEVQVFRGDTLWGVRRGEFDEQYVVRLRIEHGSGGI